VAYPVWQRFLRFDPADPIRPNRDRFVLSMGHASTLLYALPHLSGVRAVNPAVRALGRAGGLAGGPHALPAAGLSHGRASGIPRTTAVETTTGPLRQGVATSVGMAIAQQWQAAHSTGRASSSSTTTARAR
jgi:transketolase